MADLKAMALVAAQVLAGAEHVHDCTGPDMTCPCGFVFKVARFCVELNIYDNDQKADIASEGFNSDDPYVVEMALRRAADKMAGFDR